MKIFVKALKAFALAGAATMLVAAKDPRVGQPAPPFELTLIDGSKVTLDQLRGDVVILNFWATWCVPCRTELPMLDHYYDTRKDAGLRVYAIATEDSLQIFQMRRLFAVMKMPSARRIKGPYQAMEGVPTSYVIDRAGRVRYAKSGAFEFDTLDALVKPLLAEPRPAAVPPVE